MPRLSGNAPPNASGSFWRKNGKEKNDATKEEIKAYCQKKLMHYSVPYKYEFVDVLPKTAYNKIDFMKLQRESEKEAVC